MSFVRVNPDQTITRITTSTTLALGSMASASSATRSNQALALPASVRLIRKNGKFEQMGLVWFASFSTFDLEALNQLIILQKSAALLIRSSQDFGQIRICRPANSNLPPGKLGFAGRQIGVFGTILLNWNLPFSLLGEQTYTGGIRR